jgi:hypothetical protein
MSTSNVVGLSDFRKNLPGLLSVLKEEGAEPLMVLDHGQPVCTVMSPKWCEIVTCIQSLSRDGSALPRAEVVKILEHLTALVRDSPEPVSIEGVIENLVNQAKIVDDYYRLHKKLFGP